MRSHSSSSLHRKSVSQKQDTISKYIRGKLLGKGGFAKCYQMIDSTSGKTVAAKIIQKASLVSSKARQKLVSQIQIHRSITHQYIVQFQTSFEDQQAYYILMELCPNQTLTDLLRRRKRLTQLQAKCYLFQLASALQYLHKNKIIHRDLKLSNLFLSDKMQIKVGDLGLAAKMASNYERRKTICGTPNYIAPQILDGIGHSYEVDFWSYGVIAYALMVGKLPFQNRENNVNITYNKIRMCNYSFPQQNELSRSAKNFISKLLQLDPIKRMTIQQILTHDFLTYSPFPKILPITTLCQAPNSHFLKQFTITDTQKQQTKQTTQTRQTITVRRNSYSEKNNYLIRSRGSTINLLGKSQKALQVQPVQQQQTKLTRPASTTVLSKWRYLANKDQKPKQIPIESKKQKITNEIQQWINNYIEDQKYGACYTLCSGATGMFFVDRTCLIADAAYTKLKYITPSKEGQKQVPPIIFDVGKHQTHLAKKVKIFQHFKLQLFKQKQSSERKMTSQQLIKLAKMRTKKQIKSLNIFVKRHGSKNNFRYFLFNNNVLQGIFKDGTQVIIAKSNNLYINRHGEHKVFITPQSLPQDIRKNYQFLTAILKNYKPPTPAIQAINNITSKQNQNLSNINKSHSLVKKQKQISGSTNNDSNDHISKTKKYPIQLSSRIRR